MSSIRLFILGILAEAGPLHGHQIRQQAQTDRTEQWADVKPGSLYGALKRMAAEDLIRELRTERQGNRPERTVYELTAEGRRALSAIRDEALHRIDTPHDPFDLALAHSGDLAEQDRERIITDRLAALRARESSIRHRLEYADPYLNEAERMVIRHLLGRAAAEVAWHEELITRLPKIAADFADGVGGVGGVQGEIAKPGMPQEQS